MRRKLLYALARMILRSTKLTEILRSYLAKSQPEKKPEKKPGKIVVDSDLILTYLWALVGKPYVWGGQGPDGFDCSGLVVEVLKALGHVNHRYDATSHNLYLATKKGLIRKPQSHALAFYGTKNRIVHVGYCISDTLMIEAGGGTSATIDEESASKLGAMVRVRPIFGRKDFLEVHTFDKTMF